MNTFNKFIEFKLHEDAPMPPSSPAGGGGISAPGALPPGGGAAPPMGGMPPMGGGMGMGGPPMGGMPGAPTAGTAPQKLKAYNVWDVLERVLSGDGQEDANSRK